MQSKKKYITNDVQTMLVKLNKFYIWFGQAVIFIGGKWFSMAEINEWSGKFSMWLVLVETRAISIVYTNLYPFLSCIYRFILAEMKGEYSISSSTNVYSLSLSQLYWQIVIVRLKCDFFCRFHFNTRMKYWIPSHRRCLCIDSNVSRIDISLSLFDAIYLVVFGCFIALFICGQLTLCLVSVMHSPLRYS